LILTDNGCERRAPSTRADAAAARFSPASLHSVDSFGGPGGPPLAAGRNAKAAFEMRNLPARALFGRPVIRQDPARSLETACGIVFTRTAARVL